MRGRPAPDRRPPRPFVVLLVLATGAALLALVVANVLLGQIGITKASLSARVETKRTVVELTALDVARLGSPTTVETRAFKLGMIPATGVTVLSPVDAQSSVPVRGPSPETGRP